MTPPTVPVRVKRLHPEARLPRYARPGDAGFDLQSVEEVVIEPGRTVAVPTGLAFEIPEGYEMQVRPRSGLSLKTSLILKNSPGTVDSGYRGEVKVICHNLFVGPDSEPLRILPGDRIAQAVIAPVIQAELAEVEELSDTERGTGGFGHTG